MSTAAVRSKTVQVSFAWLRTLALVAGAAGIAVVAYFLWEARAASAAVPKAPVEAPPVQFVSSIGRLEPKSRVVQLAAPMAMEPARIDRLEVEEGDWVKEGTLLARLDTYGRRMAAVREAEARVAVAQARLDQVKAGAKPGDIAAQEAMVARAEFMLKNAEGEYQRADAVGTPGAITASEKDRRKTDWETAERTLQRARATLRAIKEVRTVDVKHAEAELLAAQSAVTKAQADAEATELHAPMDCRILRIHSRTGEKVGEKGVLEIANTAGMQAVAEVYEGDIGRVQIGQPASVRIPALDLTLSGEVESLGSLIGRKDIFDNDPVADTDARVVEVRIRLNPEDAKRVERLTNLRIETRIDIRGE